MEDMEARDQLQIPLSSYPENEASEEMSLELSEGFSTDLQEPGERSRPSTPTWLLLSHFLSTWNSRLFEFSAILFIAVIFPGNLLPASLYALARSSAAICFAPAVGRYVDASNRLRTVRVSIVGQRFVTAASCLVFLLLFVNEAIHPWLKATLLSLLSILACIEKLCSIMNLVSVEKDWVVVISGENEIMLQNLNSQMRRIDLFCKLIGPLAISLVDSVSTSAAITVVLMLNITSTAIEYLTVTKVYNTFSTLREPKESSSGLSTTDSSTTLLKSISKPLKEYAQHTAFLPSLSLSILYLTVLSFGAQMITYLLSTGYTPPSISLIRTFSIGFEISATWLAHLVISRIGSIRGGLWFINWQGACVVVAMCGLWVPSMSQVATAGLVGGVIASRAGLWGFDLCVQLIVQEEVEPSNRGAFSTTEASVQNLFELLSFLATAVFPRPNQFRYPALMSTTAVLVAGILYAEFVRRRRGHLLHVSSTCCAKGGERKRIGSNLSLEGRRDGRERLLG